MEWIFLFCAIILEVVGTTCLKLSNGFTRLWPSTVCAVSYLLAISAMGQTLKKLDVSLTYAIWSGMGTLLVAIIGIAYFKEANSTMKLVSIALIVVGLVGLHLSEGVGG